MAGRRGHFQMESGYHSSLWLDLDPLFAAPERVRPFVAALADALRPYQADVICGPLLGGAFLAQRLAEAIGTEFWYTKPIPQGKTGGLFKAHYRLPAAFIGRGAHRRVVLVDDVMSAGSSLRATDAAVRESGAEVVAVGALLLLGEVGAAHFAGRGVPVEGVARTPFEMRAPDACPRCRAGAPLEIVA